MDDSEKLYSICQRYKLESKLQPLPHFSSCSDYCIQYVKDINLKANYNGTPAGILANLTVFNMSKI